MKSCFIKFALLWTINVCETSRIFHENSKMTFYPDSNSEYFGYSIMLKGSSILVGAPKAASRRNPSISTGLVFSCVLHNLDANNITCYPMPIEDRNAYLPSGFEDNFFRNDMWFGATLTMIENDTLVACAPRWADGYKDRHILGYGACYYDYKKKVSLIPLKDPSHLAYITDGKRKEFGQYGTHLNFYAYGQFGMSIKATGSDSILVGAPGLMQWTGGVVAFRFPYLESIQNPYYTNELEPDNYFGYSVESGSFELGGNTLYVAGAPRSEMGYGQVLIFDPPEVERAPLLVKAKLTGPQLGSYFGATLNCLDLDGDGRSDLLVGAPTYVKKDGGVPFDQGAVFVYLTSLISKNSSIILVNVGLLTGSGESGARFGSAIADLGDLDGDGVRDVAIGAPFENEGSGAVYIYRGDKNGIKNSYIQRIVAEHSSGFGFSISKGVDVDGNNCNDLAIGAFDSSTAYLYRCLPTLIVHSVIKVPDAMNLPQDATNFTALFCVIVPSAPLWPHIKIDLKAKILIDPEFTRAMISGDSEYVVTAEPGKDKCAEQVVIVKRTADLSKPISMKFDLQPISDPEDSKKFVHNAARLSDESTLSSSFLIQLVRDCGADLICTPWLGLSFTPFERIFIPGAENRLGVSLKVFNLDEPAYGAKVNITLPLPPKRVPSSCSFEDLLMTCNVLSPLPRDASDGWDIELDYNIKTTKETEIVVKAVLFTQDTKREDEVKIVISPKAEFVITGKVLPNDTITITRDKYYEGGNITIIHMFEITNYGPSDWPLFDGVIEIPENVTLGLPIDSCDEYEYNINCTWSVPARTSISVPVHLKYDLERYGMYLDEVRKYNMTTIMNLHLKFKKMATISSVLILDPAPPIWPIVVGSIAGFILLSAIVFGLYKYGFFSRSSRDELKRLQEETMSNDEPGSSNSSRHQTDVYESSAELLSDDSDLEP